MKVPHVQGAIGRSRIPRHLCYEINRKRKSPKMWKPRRRNIMGCFRNVTWPSGEGSCEPCGSAVGNFSLSRLLFWAAQVMCSLFLILVAHFCFLSKRESRDFRCLVMCSLPKSMALILSDSCRTFHFLLPLSFALDWRRFLIKSSPSQFNVNWVVLGLYPSSGGKLQPLQLTSR